MSETAMTPSEPAAPVLPSPINYDPANAASLLLDGAAFAQIQRVGKMLSASEMVPTHLRNKPADCALVVAQAFRWGLDPLAVAQSTYVVQGKYGYEGKLIAALVNTSGRTDGPLGYAYSGEGAKRRVIVSARLRGESEPRTVEGTFEEWATQNEKWRKSPDSMLRYRGAREWARAHMPEVILGIQAEDEIPAVIELHGSTPAASGEPQRDPLAEQLRQQRAEQAQAEPVRTREPGEDDGDEPAKGRRGVR